MIFVGKKTEIVQHDLEMEEIGLLSKSINDFLWMFFCTCLCVLTEVVYRIKCAICGTEIVDDKTTVTRH